MVSLLMKGTIPAAASTDNVREAHRRRQTDMSRMRTQKSDYDSYSSSGGGSPEQRQKQMAPVRVEKKVGRNEPCPCGSGKNTNTVTVRVLLIQQACRAVILHPQMMIMLVAGAWLPRP